MPDLKNQNQAATRQALVEFYTELWGLKPDDAAEEADNILQRGPTSPIYQDRVQSAWAHMQNKDRGANEAQTALNDRRNQLSLNQTPPLPSWSAQPDPQAAAAQSALNQRRGALANPDLASQNAQSDLNQRREQLALQATPPMPASPPPISPMPLKPAAATPQHLEDANLSSWQALAQFLGYSAPRK